jgi:hypothetical protein
MLTLTDRDDKTYYMIFGPKIKLVKNCRMRKITRIVIAKFVNGRIVRVQVNKQDPNLETDLQSGIPFADFRVHLDSDTCHIRFPERGFTTDISILGHYDVFRVTFSFVMEN